MMALLKIMIVSTTQKANDASDRAHDGRHRRRGTQITHTQAWPPCCRPSVYAFGFGFSFVGFDEANQARAELVRSCLSMS